MIAQRLEVLPSEMHELPPLTYYKDRGFKANE
jgi:hypothetical protein